MYSVLIVEDNYTDSKILSYLLERKNFTVHVAHEASRAFEILGQYRVDLILLDWVLPKVNGIDILRTIKKDPRNLNTPVIIVSGKNEIRDVHKAIQSGATDYVVKPIDPLILEGKIDRMLDKNIEWQGTPIRTEQQSALISVPIRLKKISEIGLELESDVPLLMGSIVSIKTDLMAGLDLKELVGKIYSYEKFENKHFYRCSLVGMRETDLQKIRVFLRSSQLESRN